MWWCQEVGGGQLLDRLTRHNCLGCCDCRVVAVDSSQRAIDHLGVNLKLNQDRFIAYGGHTVNTLHGNCEALCLDVDQFLKPQTGHSQHQLFDLVVCDPPKLADSKASLRAAANK